MDEKNLEVRPRDGRLALFINDWNVADLLPRELTPNVSWAILHAYELGAMQMANRMQTQIASLDRSFKHGTAFIAPVPPPPKCLTLRMAGGQSVRVAASLRPLKKKRKLRGIR